MASAKVEAARRDRKVLLAFTDEEHETVRSAAQKEATPVAVFIRRAVMLAAAGALKA